MQPGVVVDHLFRHEAGRLTATLLRVLGPRQLEVAEEIVQETLLQALESWKVGPLPDNPAAWLTRVAKNRAIDVLRRRATTKKYEPDLAAAFQVQALQQRVDAHFDGEVDDDVLRLMFSCCPPSLPRAAQVALILKTLCGFSVGEIAAALLVTPVSMERRLSRAKTALRDHGLVDVDSAREREARIGGVRQAVYLLFNEGYHGAHPTQTSRDDLCGEAIRLGGILANHPATTSPTNHALMALMCLHGARLASRTDLGGALLTLQEQDRAQWSPALLRLGYAHLQQSAAGDDVTAIHIEAMLAAVHAAAPTWAATDWRRIVDLYDVLVDLQDTPITRLNRAIAIGQRDGDVVGLAALDDVDDAHGRELAAYPFLHAARGGCLHRLGRADEARAAFQQAHATARSDAERAFFAAKLQR